MFLRAPWNYDTMEASNEAGLDCQDPTLAQQNFRDECDINTIVKRFGITGQLPENVRMPTYGDFVQVNDFHSAMNAVAAAAEAFDAMPADVRARFNNDPGAFVDFCSDEANRAEAIKLGLVMPKQAEPSLSSPGEPARVSPNGENPNASA